jgi:glycerol-3-phosphate acyltransferase PlsY
MVEAALLLGAYLLGSLPTGVLLARRRGVDLRAVGSGNIGATNVARSVGKGLGALTLLGDCLKGLLPVLLARLLLFDPWSVAAVGLAAFLGHVFSLFLRFRGGKGVATALGVFLALAPEAAAIAVGLFVLTCAAFRRVSVGSLVGALALPALLAAFEAHSAHLVLAGVLCGAILLTHRENLARLWRGRENRC